MGLVSVRDAVAGILLAAEHGLNGARYILNAETLTVREFLSRVTRIAGRSAPHPMPWIAAHGAAALSTAASAVLGGRPRVSMDEARFVTNGFRVDGTHACTALGLEYTPMNRYLPSVVASYRMALERFAA
jgi:dihydroflavonol-4-reductase